uniref:Uncharacterized protein n=1 Tax=Arundo donax TaxID=35708 RepID=A0A0A9D538_ARUDO
MRMVTRKTTMTKILQLTVKVGAMMMMMTMMTTTVERTERMRMMGRMRKKRRMTMTSPNHLPRRGNDQW